MAQGRQLAALEVSDEEQRVLRRFANRRKTEQRLALRARIVLMCADGVSNMEVAHRLDTTRSTVGKWRDRVAELRLDGLDDDPRTGAPRTVSDERVDEVIRLTLEETPANATHWSVRLMAKRVGLPPATVQRIWQAFSLQPHRVEHFRLSNDPQFVDKVIDIVGLYMSPPAHAVVLCVDEKSQIQALERNQPVLPLQPGRPEQRSHGYTRHGTTTLFAPLNVATGEVTGSLHRPHRTEDFLKMKSASIRALYRHPAPKSRVAEVRDADRSSRTRLASLTPAIRSGVPELDGARPTAVRDSICDTGACRSR